jgi:hypothetical protein
MGLAYYLIRNLPSTYAKNPGAEKVSKPSSSPQSGKDTVEISLCQLFASYVSSFSRVGFLIRISFGVLALQFGATAKVMVSIDFF